MKRTSSSSKTGGQDRNRCIGSVAGVFEVLDAFATVARPMPFSEIVCLTRKSKATVHRILSTLIILGVIKRSSESNEYALTLKLWSLGMGAFAHLDLVKVARPYVERLVKDTEETAHVATLDGADCVTYLYKIESAQSIRAQFWVGKRVRSWCSATGRSMLAFLPDEASALITSHSGSDSAHRNDFNAAVLRDELLKVSKQGFAITKGDNHPEMGGIAAPVRDHTNSVVASCGIAIPAYRMTRELKKRCVPHVIAAASAISKELGSRSSIK